MIYNLTNPLRSYDEIKCADIITDLVEEIKTLNRKIGISFPV